MSQEEELSQVLSPVCSYPSESFKVVLGPVCPHQIKPQEQVLKIDEKKIFICVVNNRDTKAIDTKEDEGEKTAMAFLFSEN